MEFLQSDATAVLLSIIAIIPAHVLTLVLAWVVVTRLRSFSFREMLGWQWGNFSWWHYVLILAAFFVLAAVVGHFFPEQENSLLKILRSSRAAVFGVAFLATFSAPIVEEVVYRGVLYSPLQRAVGVPLAVLIVTSLFALVHVPQYWPSFSTISLLTLLSLILTIVRVYSKNLLPCIVLHFIFNGIQSAALVLEPYLSNGVSDLQQPAAILGSIVVK